MKNYFIKTFALSEKGATDLMKASFFMALCNIALMSFTSLLYAFLTSTIIPVLENKDPVYNIMMYLLFAFILLMAVITCYYFEYSAAYLSSYEESSSKRISLAETLRKLPLSFFGKKDLTDVTTTIMNDTASIETAFSHFIPELFGSLFSTTVLSIGLLLFNFKMGLAVLWVIPVSIIMSLVSKKMQDYYSLKSKNIQLTCFDKAQECIENIKDIKSNNRCDSHTKIMKQRLDSYESSSIVGELATGVAVTFAQMILKVGVATSMIAGIFLLVSGEIDILIFIIFLMVATRIFDPISGALINLAAVFNTLLSVDRMKQLEKTPIQKGKKSMENKGYDIVFENVEFAYNTNETVLNNVSFTAKQNEVTALVGPSGGGKSTAIKLAARFWDVNKGKITIGGEDISKIDPEVLLTKISIVFQDVILFNNTVMENIRIGKKGASDEEIITSAKNANCHDFIMAMPYGYQTLIGENGCSLSGGERQRLSIARALLKDAPIILLDEATSSLDVLNETAIQGAINNLTSNKTVIVIAHRMRTVAGANKIVLLKHGKVEQSGTHNDLIKQEGDYVNMIKLQAQSLNWKLS